MKVTINIILSTLLLTSSPVNSGWFGNSITGAFGHTLGENVESNKWASHTFSPDKRLPLFDDYNYLRTGVTKKIRVISATGGKRGLKNLCLDKSYDFYKLLKVLERKYGKFSKKSIGNGGRSDHGFPADEYRYTEGDRRIIFSCAPILLKDGRYNTVSEIVYYATDVFNENKKLENPKLDYSDYDI
jgi:hypothetical protein